AASLGAGPHRPRRRAGGGRGRGARVLAGGRRGAARRRRRLRLLHPGADLAGGGLPRSAGVALSRRNAAGAGRPRAPRRVPAAAPARAGRSRRRPAPRRGGRRGAVAAAHARRPATRSRRASARHRRGPGDPLVAGLGAGRHARRGHPGGADGADRPRARWPHAARAALVVAARLRRGGRRRRRRALPHSRRARPAVQPLHPGAGAGPHRGADPRRAGRRGRRRGLRRGREPPHDRGQRLRRRLRPDQTRRRLRQPARALLRRRAAPGARPRARPPALRRRPARAALRAAGRAVRDARRGAPDGGVQTRAQPGGHGHPPPGGRPDAARAGPLAVARGSRGDDDLQPALPARRGARGQLRPAAHRCPEVVHRLQAPRDGPQRQRARPAGAEPVAVRHPPDAAGTDRGGGGVGARGATL
ncbi:MAG: hypothetical protein AVDCRST_MAG53-117, partial [uncultured Solirubrobacteraceae bacterium]